MAHYGPLRAVTTAASTAWSTLAAHALGGLLLTLGPLLGLLLQAIVISHHEQGAIGDPS